MSSSLKLGNCILSFLLVASHVLTGYFIFPIINNFLEEYGKANSKDNSKENGQIDKIYIGFYIGVTKLLTKL